MKCAADQGLKVQPQSGATASPTSASAARDGAIVVDLTYFQQFSMVITTWHVAMHWWGHPSRARMSRSVCIIMVGVQWPMGLALRSGEHAAVEPTHRS